MASDCLKPSRPNDARLNRYLASCGAGSRRACDALIFGGRISVDGEPALNPAQHVGPQNAVCLDGKALTPQRKHYILFHKPRDVICTANDPFGRRTFMPFFAGMRERLFTVGRLDRNSEGLLIVTNDGDLAHFLMHPRHEIKKTYLVWAPAELDARQLAAAKKGVLCDGETLGATGIRLKGRENGMSVYEVTLAEGRNRHIRRMFDALGVPVKRLKRIAMGAISLGNLAPGRWRAMSRQEMALLRPGPGPAARDQRASPAIQTRETTSTGEKP